MNGAMKGFLAAITGTVGGVIADEMLIGKQIRKQRNKFEEDAAKFYEFYSVLLRWIRVRQEGRTLEAYFKRNGYKTIAIYGMKEIGEALLEELSDSDVQVKYGIDKGADDLYVATDVFKPDEELESVDVIVVTAIHYYDAIENDMRNKVSCPIVSIEDVVWEA